MFPLHLSRAGVEGEPAHCVLEPGFCGAGSLLGCLAIRGHGIDTRHLGAMDELKETELDSLAEILRRLCVRYDNLFEVPFPYTMGFH